MAKYTPGPLGPLKGKMGNLVASSWREVYYIKAKPKRSTKKPTEKKKMAQQGFGFVSSWLSSIHEFLLIRFKDYHPGWDGRLSAQSYNRKHALIEKAEGFDIDYRGARFCYGDLPGALEASVSLTNQRTLLIRWSSEVRDLADDSDALIYILACPARQHAFATGVGASRKAGQMEVEIPVGMKHGLVHVQIAFKSLHNDKTSISQYAGFVKFDDAPDAIESKTAAFCQTSALRGPLIKPVVA